MIRQIQLVWLILLCPALGSAADVAPEVDERLAGRVFEVLADFRLAIDAVETKRRAYLMQGEATKIYAPKFVNAKRDAVNTSQNTRLVVFDQEQTLIARSGQMQMITQRGRVPGVYWKLKLIDHGKPHYRSRTIGYLDTGTFGTETEEEQKLVARSFEPVYIIYPVRQSFFMGGIFHFQSTPENPVEQILKRYTLIKAHFDADGNLVARWHQGKTSPRSIVHDKEVVFGKNFNFLPIQASMYEKDQLLGRLRTSWKRQNNLWVPETFEGLRLGGDSQSAFLYHCRWVFEDQLPRDGIDVGTNCWLEKIAPLFDGSAKAVPFSVTFPDPKLNGRP